jgi:hypothetical protein
MDDPRTRGKARNYTLVALFGLFVAAVILAIAGKLLPGRVSRLAKHAGRHPQDR